MMKYYFAILGAFALFFFLGNGNTSAQTNFKDVNNQYWAKGQINYLAEKNIIGGYHDGTFKPNDQLTRAQAAKMLVKALNLPTTDRPDPAFKDIPKGHQAYSAIATISDEGLMGGTNGLFRPEDTLTRAQMAAILTKAFDLEEGSSYMIFKDVSKNHWANEKVHLISSNRITGGYSDYTFRPSNPTTRAQFSVFLAVALYPELFQPKDADKVTRETNGQVTYYGSWIYYKGGYITEKPGVGIYREKLDGSQNENLLNEDFNILDIEGDKIYYTRFIYDYPSGKGRYFLNKMDLNGENKEEIPLPMEDMAPIEIEGKMLYTVRIIPSGTSYLYPQHNYYRINLDTKEATLLRKEGPLNDYFISENGIYFYESNANAFYHMNSSKAETVNLRDISTITGNKTDRVAKLSWNIFADRDYLYYTISAFDPIKKVTTSYFVKYNEVTKKKSLVQKNITGFLINIYNNYAYFSEDGGKIFRIPLSGGKKEFVAKYPSNLNHFSLIGGKAYFYNHYIHVYTPSESL